MSWRIATSSSSNSASGASPSCSPTRRQSTARRLEWSAVPVWWLRSASTSSATASSSATRASGAEALAAGERSRRRLELGPCVSHERGVLPGAPASHASSRPRRRLRIRVRDGRRSRRTARRRLPALHSRRLLTGCRKPDPLRMPDQQHDTTLVLRPFGGRRAAVHDRRPGGPARRSRRRAQGRRARRAGQAPARRLAAGRSSASRRPSRSRAASRREYWVQARTRRWDVAPTGARRLAQPRDRRQAQLPRARLPADAARASPAPAGPAADARADAPRRGRRHARRALPQRRDASSPRR